MADLIKNYAINYDIFSNATNAVNGFQSLLGIVERLTGEKSGIATLSRQINQVTRDCNNLRAAFSEIRPEIDMSGFKSQLGQMQKAVSEFAQQTRNIMRMAMSGTDKGFAKARGAMSGDIFDAASLRYFENELKKMPQRISDAQKAVDKAKAAHDAVVASNPTYPVGATKEQIANIDAAHNREKAALKRTLDGHKRNLATLKEQEKQFKNQITNLRSSLPRESLASVAAPRTITSGMQKAIKLIPRWQREFESARAAALLKRSELSSTGASGQRYNETEEYKKYRSSLKRLRATYNLQRQAEAIKASMSDVANRPLPSILGIPPQLMEQAFTGKLTLVPDIAAARALIGAEKFNANLNLVPMMAELRAKLNAESLKVKVTPEVGKSKSSLAIGSKLDRSGLLGRAKSSYNTLQTLANRHPIAYKFSSDGSGGFALNQSLNRMAQLAQSRPVPFRMVHDGSGGFALNQALARLQELASSRPIAIKLNMNAGNLQSSVTKALSSSSGGSKSFPIDIKPKVSELSKSIRSALNGTGKSRSFFVDVKARTAQLVSSINKAIKSKRFAIDVSLKSNNLAGQVPLLERLQAVWTKLPKTGKRTYTVNLQTTGLGDLARLERVIALINNLPASKVKNYRVNTTIGETGSGVRSGIVPNRSIGGGMSGGRVYGRANNDLYTRARTWSYPFTGNTSFGARTPVGIDMMKGMGMMMGVGGAMGIIGSSLSDAVGYQNTMETAKAILKDNYHGNNFQRDYDEMTRTIRDVAMRTKFTAPESADAARFMAMAGLDIPSINEAIAPIADVAATSDMDFGLIADKMTNIMTTYKMQKPGQMRRLADMMTKTFTSTNTDMLMLAESLQYAGPMAFASGQSLAETLAMIGIMGNSGIQASMAGTTMRMMLQNIYNPNKNQAKFMKSIGLQTRDKNGNRRSLLDILTDVARLTGSNDSKNIVGNLLSGKDSKTGTDTFDAASKLFRVTAAAGGASLLSNMGQVGDLVQKILGANGNSAAVSLAKQNTVAGMWAQAKSAFTEAVVKVFEDNDMQKLIKGSLGKLIEYLKQPEFIKTMKDIFDLIVNLVDVFKEVVKYWLWLYKTFSPFINFLIRWQVLFTQIGYAMTPFIQLLGVGASVGKAFGITGAVAKSGTVAGIGGPFVGSALGQRRIRTLTATGIRSGAVLRSTKAINNSIGVTHMAAMAINPAYMIANSRMVRAEQIRNRLNYKIEQQRLSNPDERYRINQMAHARNRANLMAERQAMRMSNIRESMDVSKRYERIYGHAYKGGWWGRTGAAASRSFNAGRAAMNLSSFAPMLLGGLRSVIATLAKALGALTSPLGLAVVAVGGLVWAFNSAKNEFKKAHGEIIKRANKNKSIVEAYNRRINGPFAINRDYKYRTLDELFKPKPVVSSTKWVANPLLSHLAGVTDAFVGDDVFKKDRSTSNQILFDNLIAPNSKYLFGRTLSFSEVSDLSKTWSLNEGNAIRSLSLGVSPGVSLNEGQEIDFRKYARQASVIMAALNDPRALRESESINELAANILLAPQKQYQQAFQKTINKISALQFKYGNWKNAENLFDGRDLSKVRSSEALESQQGMKAMFQYLEEQRAYISWLYGARSDDEDERIRSISKLIEHYAKDVGLNVDFSNLQPNWDMIYGQMRANGFELMGTEEERKNILDIILSNIENAFPGISEILKHVINIDAMVAYERRDYVKEIADAFGAGANWGIKGNVIPETPKTQQAPATIPYATKPTIIKGYKDMLNDEKMAPKAYGPFKSGLLSHNINEDYKYNDRMSGGRSMASVNVNLGGIHISGTTLNNMGEGDFAALVEKSVVQGIETVIGSVNYS